MLIGVVFKSGKVRHGAIQWQEIQRQRRTGEGHEEQGRDKRGT